MKKQYLTINEASLVTNKHSNTIRELLKTNKVQYTKDNRKYLILKESLALFYKDKSDEILSFGEDKKTTVTNDSSNSLVTEQLKPLVESLTYHIKKYDEVQKLLTNSKAEKLELEKSYTSKINSLKSSFEDEKNSTINSYKKVVSKKDIFIKILFAVILVLLLIILLKSKLITINF